MQEMTCKFGMRASISRSTATLLSLVLALGLLPTPTLGAPPCGPYTLAFYEFGALYHRSTDGSFAGIDKDVVEELSRRSSCQFRTKLESRVRIWDQLAKHQLDLSVSGIATPERLAFAEFLPYFQIRNYVLMRPETAAALPTAKSFLADTKRRVAVVKSVKHGATFDLWLTKLREQQRVEELPDFDAVLRVFRAGKVDAILALPTSLDRMRSGDHFSEQFSVLDWAPTERIVHALIMSRQRVSAADRELLRAGLQSMHRDGTLEAIFTRHVGAAMARDMRVDGL
jgi:polar amino acid transport system substrate-binding protein